ncbi:glycosyltransferase family 4 protein [Natrialbaceae archaeon GCM10025810]|uniref:glycosyltransferase family 4 protein n=1 Tax=Halovalidus salilacus TaxID=3075124 RepID=UPI00361D67FC
MRIAFVSFETVFHRESETNRRLQTVLESLRDRGHEIHVCCAQFWDGEHATFEREEITYHGVSGGLEARTAFVVRLPFTLRAIGPDVIQANAEPPGQVRAAAAGSMVARAPLLVEWYGADGIPDERPYRSAARRGDRIVVPSEFVSTRVQELGGDGGRIEIVPNPIDVDRIRSQEPGERADVVYARRLDEGANLESLLLGLAELRDREWRATILGDGPERETYETLASDLRIDDRLTFAGETTRDERIAAYRGAHVFAQTATHCVFPTEMLWALASGCVGIVEYHRHSSAHELVEGWDRGFRTTSEQELADAILDAGDLEHRDFDERFADFDRSTVLDRYLELYRTLRDDSGIL